MKIKTKKAIQCNLNMKFKLLGNFAIQNVLYKRICSFPCMQFTSGLCFNNSYCLFSACYCAKCFTCPISINPHSNPVEEVL